MDETKEYKDFLRTLNLKLLGLSKSCSDIVKLYESNRTAPGGLKTAYRDKLKKIETRKKYDESNRGKFFNLFRSLPQNIKASGIAAAQLTTAAGAAGIITPVAIAASPFVGLYHMTRGGGKKTQKQKKQKNRKRTKKI